MSSIDEQQIRKLADLLSDTGLTELEIEQDDTRIRLRRESNTPSTAPTAIVQAEKPATATSSVSYTASLENALKAPIVGTYYQSPAPDAEPFVKVGDKIKKGQVVAIIEAMKTMNNVEADRSGTITQILQEDAQPVEFGQALMIIE